MVDHLPGTITFLFTDIEGSTELLQQLGAGEYGRLLSDHHTILRNAFADHSGTEIDTQGDAFFASFPRASNAVAAVVQVQQALANHNWPEEALVRVRMGLHTGEPWLIEEGYVGMDVHRAARVGHCGHGGQVLLSETTTSLVRDDLPEGVRLRDLGRHQLKDLRRPEPIHQLVIPGLPQEFPPLNSLKAYPPHSPSAGTEQVAREPRDTGLNPYRGLASFRESDAEFFFGREAFTNDLHRTISHKPVTAIIVGSSGAGKSSVVAAGLLPRLRNEPGWLLLRFRPGSQPFQALATALIPSLEPGLDEVDRLSSIQKMAAALLNREVSLALINNRVLQKNNNAQRILLIADQFEELYTLCPDPELRQAFLDELLAAVQVGDGEYQASFSLLLTLRADFMGQALAYRPFADTLKDNTLLLGPMSRDELQAAIEKPAAKQGAAFETGLVSRILDDIGQEPGNLPLLEFALTLLWEAMVQGWMTHKAYEAIGRVDGALSRHADAVYLGLQEGEQEQARRIFVQLVQPGAGTEDTRRVARRRDLAGVDWKLVQHLADERLVVTGRDESGDETVEVVHEALIRGWSRLRRWMAADREFRSWQEGLRAALLGWERSGHDEGALLRGVPLAQAEEWLRKRSEEIGETEEDFIQASTTLRDRRQAVRERRRRSIFVGLAAGLVVAIVLTFFAFNQRGVAEKNALLAQQNAAAAEESASTAEAEAFARSTQQAIAIGEAEARATQQKIAVEESQARATQQALAEERARIANARHLAGVALEELVTDPQRGLLLALHATEQTYSVEGTLLPEALTALHEAIRQNSRLRLTIPPQDDRLPYVAFGPDGERLVAHYFSAGVDPATFPDDTVTKIWDVSTGELLHELPPGIVAARWPQGEQVAIAHFAGEDEFQIQLWDIATGMMTSEFQLLYPSEPVYDEINGFVIDQDLSVIAISWTVAPRIGMWNIQSGETYSKSLFIDVDVGGSVPLVSNRPSYVHLSPGDQSLISIRPIDALSATNPRIEMRDKRTGELQSFFSLPCGYGDVEDLCPPDFSISLSGSGQVVAISSNGYGAINHLANNAELGLLVNPRGEPFSAMTFSQDDSLLAAASHSGGIYLWDTSNLITSQSSQLLLSISSPDRAIYDLAINPDKSYLASADEDGTINIWDIRPSGGYELAPLGNHNASFTAGQSSMAVSPDGHQLALASPGQTPTIWDTGTGRPQFELEGAVGIIEDIALSPDGSLIATCSHGGPLIFWDTFDGKLLNNFEGYNEGTCSLDFHPLGKSMALGFGKNQAGWYQVIDLPDLVENGSLELPFPWRGLFDGELTQLAFNAQGSLLTGVTNQGELFVWDPWLEDPIANLTGYSDGFVDLSVLLREDVNVHSAIFSPVDARMITTEIDGSVTVWDTQHMNALSTIQAHTARVIAADFSPDGLLYATGSIDGEIKIWDSESDQDIMRLPNVEGGVTSLAFSPDGKRLYAAAGDGSVRVFLMDAEELIALARSRAARSLTQQDCQVYLDLDICP